MGTAYGIANDEDSFNAYYERPGTISLLGDVTGLRVLDAGCGPGALSKWLVDNGATVTAMDVSPEMVRLARQRMGDRARILTADLAEPLTSWPTRAPTWSSPHSCCTMSPTGPRRSRSFGAC